MNNEFYFDLKIEDDIHDQQVKTEKPNKIIEKSINPEITISKGFKTLPIYLLAGVLFFSIPEFHFILSYYKNFGFSQNYSDKWLTIICSISLFCNGAARILWGKIVDYFQYTTAFIIQLTLIIIFALFLGLKASNSLVFAICYICINISSAGIFVLLPLECISIYGPRVGPTLYGINQIANYISAIFVVFAVNYIKPLIGFGNLNFLFIFSVIIAFIMLFFLQIKKSKNHKKK